MYLLEMLHDDRITTHLEKEKCSAISQPHKSWFSNLCLQVKEERPSPIGECGLCMHNPRTPHTSECVYPYGLAPPSPVALMPGPPRPLVTTPPQRPVPHLPTAQQPPQAVPLSSPLYQRSIKQEKLDGMFTFYFLVYSLQIDFGVTRVNGSFLLFLR